MIDPKIKEIILDLRKELNEYELKYERYYNIRRNRKD